MTQIKKLPVVDRPREKLMKRGPEALSDLELLAALLGSGTRGTPVFPLARAVLDKFVQNTAMPAIGDLTAIDGIGTAKACQIMAALEFSRRRLQKTPGAVKNALDALPYLYPIAGKKQEHFICLSLNGANELIGNRVITVGLLNTTQVHPREVFADAIAERAASIIIAHNHPSGRLTPSKDDIAVTRQLSDAGKILGIGILDHIIVSGSGYYSFVDNGLLP